MQIHMPKQSGLTLVELMVAMVLGLFLTGMMITIYLGSKQSFTMTTQVAHSQESTRFAAGFLKRDLRMAGYTECSKTTSVNSLLKTPVLNEAGIYGWEYNGTEAGNSAYALTYQKVDPSGNITAARSANTSTAGNWASLGSTSLPSVIHDLEPINGSDIVVITREEKLPVKIVPITNTSDRRVSIVDSVRDIATRGNILKIGNCNLQDKFQNRVRLDNGNSSVFAPEGVGSNYSPGNTAGPFRWSAAWTDSDSIYKEVTTIYYVGTGASGVPSLFRLKSDCGLSPNCQFRSAASEAVEGVESMQILYGEDTDATPDGVANIYRSADDVTNFSLVVSVKLAMLIRSPSNAKADTGTSDYLLADSITIDVPNDRLLRYVTNSTIHLRNLGL